jgi:hypothetical protein
MVTVMMLDFAHHVDQADHGEDNRDEPEARSDARRDWPSWSA